VSRDERAVRRLRRLHSLHRLRRLLYWGTCETICPSGLVCASGQCLYGGLRGDPRCASGRCTVGAWFGGVCVRL
jgi:hypothetical protein